MESVKNNLCCLINGDLNFKGKPRCEKHAEPLFWDIIHRAGEDSKKLKKILEKLPTEEVYSYDKMFSRMVGGLYHSSQPCRDGVDYEKFYHVACGKKHYYTMLKCKKDIEGEDGDGELFSYVPLDVLEDRGEDPYGENYH